MLTLKRSLALMLAVLMAAAVFVGCASNGETEKQNYPMQESYLDSLGEVDLGGKVYRVITDDSNMAKQSLSGEAPNGDVIDNALYQRNQEIFARLNASTEVVRTVSAASLNDVLRESVLAFNSEYDIVSAAQYDFCRSALQGILINLNSLEAFDFSQPYWSQAAMKAMSYKGDMYFATGDITPGYMDSIYVTFVNTELLSKYHPDLDIYALVESGEWTFEKMAELAAPVFFDGDGDGKADCVDHRELAFKKYPETVFGFLFDESAEDNEAYLTAANIVFSQMDEEGVSSFTYDLDRINSYVSTVSAMLATEGVLNLVYDGVSPIDRNTFSEQEFSRGATLFNITTMSYVNSIFRDAKDDYIVIPMPKLNAEQESYQNLVRDTVNLFAIPLDCSDPDGAAQLLEALAAESYRTVTTAYYNKLTDYAYDASSKDAKMIELIRAAAYSDFGYAYHAGLNVDEVIAGHLAFDEFHQVDQYRRNIHTAFRDYITRGFSYSDLLVEKFDYWTNDYEGIGNMLDCIR